MAEAETKTYRLKKGFTHSVIVAGELVSLLGDGTDNVTADLNEAQAAAFGDKFEALGGEKSDPADAATVRDDKVEKEEEAEAEAEKAEAEKVVAPVVTPPTNAVAAPKPAVAAPATTPAAAPAAKP